MNANELWLTPLILLPGVALLVLSTSIRYARIHDEFHVLGRERAGQARALVSGLLRRARMFRNALVGLYVSATLLALAGLTGGIAAYWLSAAASISAGLTFAAIAAVVYAAAELVRECTASFGVFRHHAEEWTN